MTPARQHASDSSTERDASRWALGGAACVSTLALLVLAVACSDDAGSPIDRRSASSSGATSDGGADDPSNPNKLPPEEAKFRVVEPDLVKSCGKTCHDTGTYTMPAPTFLAGPDVYKSIKSQRGIVVRDVFTSALLTKGTHAGPALSLDVELEKKVLEWLEAEAIVIQSQKLPTTPAFTVTTGANDIDLSPACVSGLTGVHLKFDAAIVGTSLSLTKLVLTAPAGQDVHILQPRFVRVLPKANELGTTDIPDPADSFSNADQTVPGGKEASLSPGSVLFSHPTWRPFDAAADKLRVEVTKLEPGKVSVVAPAAVCKNPQGFTNNVLPTIRAQTATNGTCLGCHGGGTGGMNLSSTDTGFICQQILGKLNQADVAQSLIVTKVSGGMAHQGGTVGDVNAWRQLFVGNAAVFF
jgi:hypothetical protein